MNTKIFGLALLILTSACSPETLSTISIQASIEENETLAIGESFELEIEATDSDGIESVSIEIPELGINDLNQDITKKNWKKTQTINIGSSATPGKAEILVVVTDDKGEVKTGVSSLTIK